MFSEMQPEIFLKIWLHTQMQDGSQDQGGNSIIYMKTICSTTSGSMFALAFAKGEYTKVKA